MCNYKNLIISSFKRIRLLGLCWWRWTQQHWKSYLYHIIIIVINHAPLEALSGDLFSGKKTKQTLSQPQVSSRRRGLVIQMRVPIPVLPQALTLDESLNISVPWFLHLLSGGWPVSLTSSREVSKATDVKASPRVPGPKWWQGFYFVSLCYFIEWRWWADMLSVTFPVLL